jgi:hypothetical protein
MVLVDLLFRVARAPQFIRGARVTLETIGDGSFAMFAM